MITGTKRVLIDGQTYQMRFDWEALAEIEGRHGENPNLFQVEVLASVASSGLIKRHPEMTPERIKELSPPLIPFAQEVQEAMRFAYFGDEPLPEDTGEKKSRLTDGLWSRIKRRFAPGWMRSHSGA
jgi:hypothetical protein